jgi:hypothetical protein
MDDMIQVTGITPNSMQITTSVNSIKVSKWLNFAIIDPVKMDNVELSGGRDLSYLILLC